jgi:tight adherence protein B
VSIPLDTWAAAALVFVAVALGAVSLALLFEFIGEHRRQRDLMGQLRRFEEGLRQARMEGGGLLRRVVGESRLVRQLVAAFPSLGEFHLVLQQAGVNFTVGAFLVAAAGLAAALGLSAYVVSGNLFIAGLFFVFGAALPWFWVQRRRHKRLGAFEAQLPDAIDLLGRTIRAGHPLSSGLKMVADETTEPIAGEFRRAYEEHRFGVPFEDAVQAMADRVDLMDMRILVTAVLIQREVGGNLAEVLDNLSSVIRVRFTVRRQLRVHTAQGRMSGLVLGLLPIVVGLAIYMLNPEYGSLMFQHPVGKVLIVMSALMQVAGFFWIHKIVSVDI